MTSRLKQHVKTWLGRALSLTALHRPLLRDRGLVLLFHRVDDRLPPDGLTRTESDFETLCEFLGRHFEVVSVSDFVDRLRAGRSVGGCAAVTFDDGYLDNYRVAAPILERHGIPACFFVATNFVESNHVPWWDEGLPVEVEWMSWDQVRELQERGFEIGCHTMTHPDLGVIPQSEAESEILGSQQRLASELPKPVRHFAYPYGGRAQATHPSVAAVRRAGFDSCLSAYGGLVANREDPYRVQRMPISGWFENPYQLLFEVVLEAHARDPERPEPF